MLRGRLRSNRCRKMALRSPPCRSFFAFRAIFLHEKIPVLAVGYELLSSLKWAVRPVATS
jgi:hypothetical protein